MKTTILLPKNEKISFSNDYSRWDDSFFYFPNEGDKLEIKIRKHKNNVSVEYFPPEPYTWLNSVKREYTYEQFNTFNIERY